MSPQGIVRAVPVVLLLAALAFVPTATADPIPDEWVPDCVPGDLECGWQPPTSGDVYSYVRGAVEDLKAWIPDCVPGDLECGWPPR